MTATAFTPELDGFHFANTFVNRVVTTPFGTLTTRGRCGGMAFAALDFFHASRAIPDYRTAYFGAAGCPPDGDPLADYIYARLLDSFTCSTANQFASWTIASDHATWISPGVTAWTRNNSWPFLKHEIDAGRPVALGLIAARSLDHIGDNHQIVGYGYDEDASGLLTVHVYDDNDPDAPMTLQTGPGNPHWNESSGEIWRGWFVQSYTPRMPPSSIPAKFPGAPPPQPKVLNTWVVSTPTPIAASTPVTFKVDAVDSATREPVAGDVRVGGVLVGSTNSLIRYTFHRRLVPRLLPVHPIPGPRPPVELWPAVTVTASGYPDVRVSMPFA